MSHFSADQWFEYVRHMPSLEASGLIAGHLTEGCSECKALFEFWKEVLETAQRESNYHPSKPAVESAKAVFNPEEHWRWFPQIAQVARLLFDSLLAPMPAAVRGSTVSSRQLLHVAPPFVIDLRLEYESSQKPTRVMGQVLNSKEPGSSVTGVEIFLLGANRLIARTRANDSGEFQLEFKQEEGLQLFVDISPGKIVEILLPHSPVESQGRAVGAE